MEMTKEKAQEKWCPFLYSGFTANPTSLAKSSDYKCQTEDCMMWEVTIEGKAGFCALKRQGLL